MKYVTDDGREFDNEIIPQIKSFFNSSVIQVDKLKDTMFSNVFKVFQRFRPFNRFTYNKESHCTDVDAFFGAIKILLLWRDEVAKVAKVPQ